jgi:hypothetical protein
MNLSRRVKVTAGAFALMGVVAAGGAAFTSTGITTTHQAASSQFIGGTVAQSVTGATLQSIIYTYADAPPQASGVSTNTEISVVTLTFADALADGAATSIVFTTDAGGTPVAFTCENVGATTSGVSTCLPTTPGTFQTQAASIAVTVASTNNVDTGH